jgi:hypothetical protein
MMTRYDIPRWKHGGFTRKINEWPEAEITIDVMHAEILAVDVSETTSTALTRYVEAGGDLNIMGASFYGNAWDAYYADSLNATPEDGRDRIAIQDCGELAIRMANDFAGVAFGDSLQAEEDTQTIEGNSITVSAVQEFEVSAITATTAITGTIWRTYQAEEMTLLGKAMEYKAANTDDDTHIYCQLTILRPYIVVPAS